MIGEHFVCFTATGNVFAVYCEAYKVLLVCMPFKRANLRKIKKKNEMRRISCSEHMQFLKDFEKLTGIFSFTSHNRNVLSVEAEASSVLDKNFTYETAFLCPLKT